MSRRTKRALRFALGAACSTAGLILVLRGVDWPALGEALRRARPGWLAAAVLAELLSILVNAVRWRSLYGPHHHPEVGRLFGILTVAQLGNTVLPGRPGLLLRVALAGGDGVSRATTVTTLAVEKVLEGATLLLLGALLLLSLELPPEWRSSALIGALVMLALLAILAGGLRWRDRWLGLGTRIGGEWLRRLTLELLDGLDVLRSTRAGWRLWAWSWVYWAVLAIVNWLVVGAMGLSVSPLAALVLLVVLQFGVRVPSSPGNIGVFDYLGVISLALQGVEKSPAVGTTLLLHLVLYLPPSLVGAVYLLWTGTGLRLKVQER
jgi:uncharacterized protein (TIRG00374 family)